MVELKRLTYYYPKSRAVLEDVSMNLGEGNVYGLLGRNGEGKSTLLKIVTGLLFPKMGLYHFMGGTVSRKNIKLAQDIFFIPEDFELPGLTIFEYEKVHSVFYPRFSKDLFYNIIKEFDLNRKAKISTLSFGQKKKVLIAFGIATNTRLLLMDEPTNGLDIPSKSQLRKIIASVSSHEKCIVIATHQVRDLHSLINHLIVLDQSRVVFDHELSLVSERLWFGKPHKDDEKDILYSENSWSGKAIVAKKDKNETEIDLELLFNGILHRSDVINNELKKGYSNV